MTAVQIAEVLDLALAAFILVGTACVLIFSNRKRKDKKK